MPPKENVKSKAKSKPKPKQKTKAEKITESKMLKIEKAKEERSLNLFYKLSEPELEEETLEQKNQRKKKELKNNTFV